MSDHAFRPNSMVPISCAICGNERRFHADAPPPPRPVPAPVGTLLDQAVDETLRQLRKLGFNLSTFHRPEEIARVKFGVRAALEAALEPSDALVTEWAGRLWAYLIDVDGPDDDQRKDAESFVRRAFEAYRAQFAPSERPETEGETR